MTAGGCLPRFDARQIMEVSIIAASAAKLAMPTVSRWQASEGRRR